MQYRDYHQAEEVQIAVMLFPKQERKPKNYYGPCESKFKIHRSDHSFLFSGCWSDEVQHLQHIFDA